MEICISIDIIFEYIQPKNIKSQIQDENTLSILVLLNM